MTLAKKPGLDLAAIDALEVEHTLFSRAGWGAQEPRGELRPLEHPVKHVLMSLNTRVAGCTTEEECKARMRELQKLHMDKGLPDLHYNFAVGGDGNLYEGRGWHYQPEEINQEFDEKCITVAFLGDGDVPDDPEEAVGHRRTIVPRDKWGAVPPRETTPLPFPINTVVFAYNTEQPVCTTEEECCKAMKQMQEKHMAMGLSDIYYNFCVGGDGAMYEGRGWNAKHSKTASFLLRNLPRQCLSDCFVIGVIGDGRTPPDAMWKKPYETVAPGMRMVNKGIKEGKIHEYHNTMEEYESVRECEGTGC